MMLLARRAAAQEAPPPNTGTVQGTVRDSDGNPIEGARVAYHSKDTETGGQVRTGKDGTYISEPLPAGTYTVRGDAQDYLASEATVAVTVGAAATADFRLDEINPGPIRLESRIAGTVVNRLPIDGRNVINPARLEPGAQVVDSGVLDAGKSGYQGAAINNRWGRTTHYDVDQVESMDETRGGPTLKLPADGISELILTRATPEVYQSLNATGAVEMTTRSGSDEWYGDLFGDYRDRRAGLAGFPSGDPEYSRQLYGFGVGGALIKDKVFVSLSGERLKQDGQLPFYQGFPFNQLSLRDASDRDNMLTARLDYDRSENARLFARISYDNAKQFGPVDSWSKFQDQVNVPSAMVGADWNRGRFAHSGRFGYQKLVNAINPAFGRDSALVPLYPNIHQQIGSFSLGPSNLGPRQTIQRDLFGRYDGSTLYKGVHTFRFGGAIHHITQGDFYSPGLIGPSVTSSNSLAVIQAINSNPNLLPIVPGDPRGAADNPLNYPVGTFTIYNGLGNFSEHSSFNRSTGGHLDTRIEGYVADKFNVFPNLNVTVGVNYVRDSGRTDSDLAAIPVLDQFGLAPPVGAGSALSLAPSVNQPNFNFAPQAGVAWDPGHNGRTVIRASGGMFFDNFLLQNSYQDRINRLSSGQYARSLTLCPTGAVLFPDGSVRNTADGLDIASQICGQPLVAQMPPIGGGTPVQVAQAIEDLQSAFVANQATVTGGPNVYSVANTQANFGGLLAPTYKTPRVVHMSAGIERQMGERSSFSIDYVREIGTQFPLGIDTNHVGDSRYLTDGTNQDPSLNKYTAELAAINMTLAAKGLLNSPCLPATSAGSSAQTAVQCYISNVQGASIVDFAQQGLDSSNAFCGPFPCSVLGKNQASFGGINPAAGSNIMYFPAGRSKFQAVHFTWRTSGDQLGNNIRHWDLALSYTFSDYKSNIGSRDGSGGDYSVLTVAQDYNRPHLGNFGPSGLDRRHMLAFTPSFEFRRGPRLTMVAQLASPLPLSLYLPQQNGGGVAGEIFRTDFSGDGTVGDRLPGTNLGTLGRYKAANVDKAIVFYNSAFAGKLTSAGQALVNAGLFSGQQLVTLGAVMPTIQALNANATPTWLKTIDLRFSWPVHIGERFVLEPHASAFNILNLANFGGPGQQLSGVLDGSPGTSFNNANRAGVCGNSIAFCTTRLDRIMPGSGTYGVGAPRQIDFGVRLTF